MLKTLCLEKFRNFDEKKLDFTSNNYIIGPNGFGKSNILESIRLLSVGKSFKTSRFDEVVKFDEAYFRVNAAIKNDEELNLELFYGIQFAESPIKEKQLTVNNQNISWIDFSGEFPSVLFTPADLEIIFGSPQVRRRYIDSILWQVDKEFRYDYLELTKVLKERSALLFLIKINRAGLDELKPWNEILMRLTKNIRDKRLAYLEFLREFLEKESGFLKISVEYIINDVDMANVQSQEIKLSQNIYGPHRDEFEIFFNEKLARRFASRGQARASIVLIKAAEAAYLKEKTNHEPVILLDDLFSELDKKRADNLMNMFLGNYQIIATSIEPIKLEDGWKEIKL